MELERRQTSVSTMQARPTLMPRSEHVYHLSLQKNKIRTDTEAPLQPIVEVDRSTVSPSRRFPVLQPEEGTVSIII